ncbi:MAG: DNA repair protein RecN [Armatimonadota bacterium]|nr:DNA repair protein RecN [bacterium]MDW8103789.1 DNA repair protein RecN [Armatimonadota bacterium]MDW8289263.1 DNA repair protein RecN [Armatimonadota bacterium]
MLLELAVEQIAIIDRLNLRFEPGLNVLTGETGAGKSILVDALSLALGERAEGEMLRAGAEHAQVTAVFDVSRYPLLQARLQELGVTPEEGLLYLTRELLVGGRSQARINGRPVPVATLKAVGDLLVDLHGQHQHQLLFQTSEQLRLLDEWCGEGVLSLKAELGERVREMRALQRELSSLQADARERAHLLDLYTFQKGEIERAHLTPGEEEELLAEERRLAHAEKLFATAETAYELLTGGEPAAVDLLAQAARTIEEVLPIDASLQPLVENLQNALYAVQDVATELRAYRDRVEFSPERLNEVQERLHLIRTLKRKYGDTIEAVLAYLREITEKLERLQGGEERAEELERALSRVEQQAQQLAAELSQRRREGARRFEQAVAEELSQLAMPRVRFEVKLSPKPLEADGADAVEFLLAPNPGEPPRPLSKIASGGELSRVMLAMKSVLSGLEDVPTLVFDEIDIGIGGRTAGVVGEKLHALSRQRQILCITHLPQIASRARLHLLIEKRESDGRTVTTVTPVEGDARVREIARMLGDTGDSALRHAREMLEAVR